MPLRIVLALVLSLVSAACSPDGSNDLAGRQLLPRLEGGNSFPLWSYDDEKILSMAARDGEQVLVMQSADGSGRAEVVASPARAPEAWTPNGRLLNFITLSGGEYAISTWDRYDKVVSRLVQRAGSLQHSSHYSPDGRWLVYASHETGAFEVFVEPVPSTGDRHRVTNGGGEHPLWSPDGTRILFDRAAELYQVRVTTAGDRFSAGEPEALPIKGFAQSPGLRRQFDIAPDGRLLMLVPAD
jgi:Tol biopolymer transport system component